MPPAMSQTQQKIIPSCNLASAKLDLPTWDMLPPFHWHKPILPGTLLDTLKNCHTSEPKLY